MNSLSLILCLFTSSILAAPIPPQARQFASPDLPRLILYHQTTHDPAGRPISLLPLITKQHIALTHLIVGAFHLNANHTIHLNDHPPSHPMFYTLWNETRLLQNAGIKVLGMVGGAAPGSFASDTLDAGVSSPPPASFETAYGLLHNTVTTHHLDGLDLDIEEPTTQPGITSLIHRLRADFGPSPGFTLTLAPVATALLADGRSNLSGFNYTALDAEAGALIDFYNAQFYNGFGGPGVFDGTVANGFAPGRVVVGQLTSPALGGGFVGHQGLRETVDVLRGRYGEIGGVAGWEYFDGVPGGVEEPWRWAEEMTRVLRGGYGVGRLGISREVAEGLERAWEESAKAGMGEGRGDGTAERWMGMGKEMGVDYMAMVEE
ncbi:glycoside hydrolase [Staphylotrichum tortipilum]|uniref:Glycoside hydrolase n=1 Tax=Staphylotrichum tortipilum TaxID=2831512 RepID=A0AAN6MAP2_9PEZI|nr:glycoside hydrolase [Staphylotrichum longicolle]